MKENRKLLAEALEMTREETIAKLKENYDGYHFSPASPDVFNPYSLLNCFDDKNFGAYWFIRFFHSFINSVSTLMISLVS